MEEGGEMIATMTMLAYFISDLCENFPRYGRRSMYRDLHVNIVVYFIIRHHPIRTLIVDGNDDF